MDSQIKTYVKYGVVFSHDTIVFNPLTEDAGNGFVSPSALHRCTEILNECLADFNSFIEQHTKYLVGLGERFRAREWASFWAIPLSNKGDFYLYFNAVDTKPTKICIAKTEDYLFE